MNLNEIPTWPQRQDSVAEQLADLRIIANKLGFHDAADAIGQWCESMPELKYGCHCDLGDGEEPDDCVFDISTHNDCIYALDMVMNGNTRKETCEYWRPICKN